MKPTLRFTLLLSLVFLIGAPPCWAKAKGYLYVVGYSFAKKKVYFSHVIMQKVRNKSYSEEEYVTEVELVQKMESQFQKHLSSTVGVNLQEYTVSARGAFKNQALAEERLKKERDRFLNKGYMATVLTGFVYND
jgi:hypothetical protein